VGADEDKQLREMVEAGKSVTMMALRLKRTEMDRPRQTKAAAKIEDGHIHIARCPQS
jgi:hypothetical protein